MISARLVVVVLLGSLVAAATPAVAQPAGDQADALFSRGRDLMKEGKLEEACGAFEQSQQLAPKVTTLLNLAGCREKAGRLATAHALFREAEEQTRPESDAMMAQLHKIALGHVSRLAPSVSKLTIRVADGRTVEGLEILRDGARIPAEQWNRELPIDGGTYRIVARAPGVAEWSEQVTVAAEADAKAVEVPELRPEPPTLDKPVQPAQPAVEGGRRGLGLPLAVGAGAVALLGGALGVSLWGDSTYDKAKAELSDQARRDSLEASANRKRYAAEGMAIAGAGCAGVAVWLYLRQRGGRAEAASRTGLMLVPAGSGVGLAGRF